MNDIERAIETLKMENELMQFDPMTGEIEPIELQNQDNQDLYKANLIAIQALEKQIAKKPSEQSYNQSFMDEGIDDGVEYLCPNCKSIVGAYSNSLEDWLGQQKYCEDCGQKIDWR